MNERESFKSIEVKIKRIEKKFCEQQRRRSLCQSKTKHRYSYEKQKSTH